MTLEQRNGGFWWPIYAKPDNGRYLKHAEDMRVSLKHVPKKTVAVQAGGHVGMWPLWLSDHFKTVYTFEPEPRNFEALMLNVRGRNVVATNGALTDHGRRVSLNVSKNAGGHSVVNKDGVDEVGSVQSFRIDDLQLAACDFIMLDVEGYEWPALKGAELTLRHFRPVLQLEDRGHGIKKGRGDTFEVLHTWLKDLGYVLTDRVRNDAIFIHKGAA